MNMNFIYEFLKKVYTTYFFKYDFLNKENIIIIMPRLIEQHVFFRYAYIMLRNTTRKSTCKLKELRLVKDIRI